MRLSMGNTSMALDISKSAISHSNNNLEGVPKIDIILGQGTFIDQDNSNVRSSLDLVAKIQE
jgi:hypothetical protein